MQLIANGLYQGSFKDEDSKHSKTAWPLMEVSKYDLAMAMKLLRKGVVECINIPGQHSHSVFELPHVVTITDDIRHI